MSNLTIPASLEAGAIARRAVSRWMGDHPRLDDVLLAMTELVDNAVLHGGLDAGEDLIIAIEPDDDGIRLAVRHAGVRFQPQPAKLSQDPGASRGLAIVERITDGWGVETDGAEVSAWFEVTPTVDELGR